MKKTLTTLLLALIAITSQGVNVLPRPVTITQKDGTQLTVIGYGDEHFHYFTTTDGALLYHQGQDFYIAATDAAGLLTPTKYLAHEEGQRTIEEKRVVLAQDKQLFLSATDKRLRSLRAAQASEDSNTPLFTHTGTPKVLVIMAEFTDQKFTVNEPWKAFDQFLNKISTADSPGMNDYGNHDTSNYGSVAEYFKSMSFGAFQPSFELYGPVQLDHDLAYYGEGEHTEYLIPDACKKAKDLLGTDFAQYDQDGDGYVDLVYVICAGYSEAWSGNATKYIWPRSGWRDFTATFDGKKIGRYGVSVELCGIEGQQIQYIDGIGVFCHEMSHTMGLPDFYVTSSSAECKKAENQAMEEWSLMDAGEYVSNSYYPTAYTAWERAYFGWMELTQLKESQKGITTATIDEGGKAYQIVNPANPDEYFILQNIQQDGWNKKQRGHGLLVYHVDYDKAVFSINSNSVNNSLGHPRMTVIPADGLLMNRKNDKYKDMTASALNTAYRSEEAGDVFPGTKGITVWNDASLLPNAAWYNGVATLGFSLTGITEAATTGTVTFDYTAASSTGIEDSPVTDGKPQAVYTLDGICVGHDATTLPRGLYIVGHKKVLVK